MIKLQFQVAGDVQLSRGIERFADDVKDLRKPFKEIAASFKKIEEKQFGSQGGYGSGGWAALRESTIARKERGGYPMTIMVRSGALRDSLTKGASGAIVEIHPLDLTLGTGLPHAIFHQKGIGVVARPLIQLTEQDKRDWMKILQKYLVTQARKRMQPAAGQPYRTMV